LEIKRSFILASTGIAIVAAVVTFALLQKTPSEPAGANATPAPAAADLPRDFLASASAPAVGAASASASAKPTPQNEIPAWENQIDQVLRSNVNEAQTAQILLNILPTLPEDGQIEAANHIANLLPDENYAQAKPVLLNPNMPESVLSVLFTDLMNRSDPVKLHTFLDIAKIPNHPFHEEALSDLQIYLGDDYGTDWGKWNAALEQYLKNAAQ